MDAAEVTNKWTHFITRGTFKGTGVLSLKKSRHIKNKVVVSADLKVTYSWHSELERVLGTSSLQSVGQKRMEERGLVAGV